MPKDECIPKLSSTEFIVCSLFCNPFYELLSLEGEVKKYKSTDSAVDKALQTAISELNIAQLTATVRNAPWPVVSFFIINSPWDKSLSRRSKFWKSRAPFETVMREQGFSRIVWFCFLSIPLPFANDCFCSTRRLKIVS
ncbi:hypothetical protein CEXT_480721 [Caerostris extrusa]|uniref:Uncharacterized protein n=1 Tax=Caerostris extrusa TaxID=172846 RepID=A0AAV4X1J5_CAEEX|nr:hypothetical protein CEXT_480721 [Caerostris extrusa]